MLTDAERVIDFVGARAARRLEDETLTFDEAVAGLKYAAKHGRYPTLEMYNDGRCRLTMHPVPMFDDDDRPLL